MELNIESASTMTASQLQAEVGNRVAKIALDAAKMQGAQTVLLIESAAPQAPAPNATTGVQLDTFA